MHTLNRVAAGAAFLGLSPFVLALTVPGPVVDDAWLAAHRNEVTVLDVRPNAKSFTAAPQFEVDKKSGQKFLVELGGHIGGATLVDNKKVRTERTINGVKLKGMIPEKADFEKLVRSWGVQADKPIVIVSAGMDPMDFNDASRLFWQFKVYGEDNIAVLNGGTAGWIASGNVYGNVPVAPAAGNWVARSDRSGEFTATSQDVVNAQKGGSVQLIDARSDPFYLGLSVAAPTVTAPGHIAGAKNLFTGLMSTASGHDASKLRSVAAYKDMFEMSGLNGQAPAITYCNTGHQASGTWFVMTQILGNKHVKLYDGSMHEWSVEKRPTVAVAGSK